MTFNEDSRVKIPSILHLNRLGYQYLSLKTAVWDESTNIFTNIFKDSIARINSDLETGDLDRLLAEIRFTLENEDLGKAFYDRLLDRSGDRIGHRGTRR